MNRGSASFTTMKGFMGDFVAKGDGHEEETLPLDTGADITETAELDDAQVNAPKAANIKKSDNKPGDPTTTMSEEVKEVEAGAEEDIADSYVSDVQHLPGPGDRVKKGLGYEDFNNMVAKGHVVQVSSGMNVHNVHDTMGLVQKAAMEDFDLLAREASPYTMKGMQDLSYDGGFEDLTVGKGLSSLVYKGDTEDMSLEDGYTEDSDSSPEYTEESDDDKETQGMNEPSPQTSEGEAKADAASGAENPEEAEVEDEEPIEDEASSDNTTDALGKGWMAYERNFVGKGFQVEEKAGSGAKQVGWLGGKLREAQHWAKTNRGKRALAVAGGVPLAGGAGYAGGKYANSKDKKKTKSKGFDAYNEGFATKGFDVVEKKLLGGNWQDEEDAIRRQRGEKPKQRAPKDRRFGSISDEIPDRKTTTGYVKEGTKPKPAPGPTNASSVAGSNANKNALKQAADKKAANAPGWLSRNWDKAKKFAKTPSRGRALAVGGALGAGALGTGYALGRDKGVDDQGIVVKSVGGVKKKTSRVLYR